MNKFPQVTEIQIIPVKPRDGLVAFTSFVLNDQFYVGDVAIYTRLNGGYRLVYPTKILTTGKQLPCFHPINRTVSEYVEKKIIFHFENLMTIKGRFNDTRTEAVGAS